MAPQAAAIGGSDYSIAPGVVLGGAGSDLSYQSNNKNAGNYSAKDGGLLVSGLYSNQQGYDISYQGSFEITSPTDRDGRCGQQGLWRCR
jgi:hypothetical protein